jgi:hypothetical protein
MTIGRSRPEMVSIDMDEAQEEDRSTGCDEDEATLGAAGTGERSGVRTGEAVADLGAENEELAAALGGGVAAGLNKGGVLDVVEE